MTRGDHRISPGVSLQRRLPRLLKNPDLASLEPILVSIWLLLHLGECPDRKRPVLLPAAVRDTPTQYIRVKALVRSHLSNRQVRPGRHLGGLVLKFLRKSSPFSRDTLPGSL